MSVASGVEPPDYVSPLTVFLAFLRLGLTSFGGPVAHLGYFHDAFVVRRKWLGEQAYADLVALCQFLPGPASSQVGMGIGLAKAGVPGAFAAWLGFTTPSAILMTLFGFGVASFRNDIPVSVLHGLMVAAVAVVAQAVLTMAERLCPDAIRRSLAVVAAIAAVAFPVSLVQIVVLAAAAAIGPLVIRTEASSEKSTLDIRISRTFSVLMLALFFVLLIGLPLLAQIWPDMALVRFASFYRAGSLVFGGGHVVLPLLQSAVVPRGWISNDTFLAGYGAAQAVPGPLFTFAAYLGTVMEPGPNGVAGALICTVAIFLPSFLLVFGILPFWGSLRRFRFAQSALAGVNAAVVGILLAALYSPVWPAAIRRPSDFALAIAAFRLLVFWKVPPWVVVILSAAGAWAVTFVR